MVSGAEGSAYPGNSPLGAPRTAERGRINGWPIILIACVIIGTGSLFFNVMGLILDSTDGFGLGLAFAGVWIFVAYALFWKAAQSGASARS